MIDQFLSKRLAFFFHLSFVCCCFVLFLVYVCSPLALRVSVYHYIKQS